MPKATYSLSIKPLNRKKKTDHFFFFQIFISLILFFLFSCNKVTTEESRKTINSTLDDWHLAASEADFEKYFDFFHSNSSVFMGTDAKERWTIAEFKPWSKPYFERGKAWNFKTTKRHVYLSDTQKTAWFDEVLDTTNLGILRGSGVLIKTSKGWKIDHYNLSIPIPNELTKDFIPKIDSILNQIESQ